MNLKFISGIILFIGFSFVVIKLVTHTKNNDHAALWKKLLVIGDSNIQIGFSNQSYFLGLLSNKLQRYCDVINRGFGGYNTRFIKLILPQLLSEFIGQVESIVGVIFLLGTNDSAKSELQHTELETYIKNYQWIIDYLESFGIPKQDMIIITPPKIADYICKEYVVNATFNSTPNHCDSWTKKYVAKCIDIAKKNQITYVNLNRIMENTKEPVNNLLFDGLHLSTKGGKLLFENLWPVVYDKYIANNKLRQNFPDWDQIDYKNHLKTLPQVDF